MARPISHQSPKKTEALHAYFIHTRTRARQRLGMVLTRAIYNRWVHHVRSHSHCTFVAWGNRRRRILHLVWHHGDPAIVVYDRKHHAIVTTWWPSEHEYQLWMDRWAEKVAWCTYHHLATQSAVMQLLTKD